jgi:hypothetical protein
MHDSKHIAIKKKVSKGKLGGFDREKEEKGGGGGVAYNGRGLLHMLSMITKKFSCLSVML